MKTKTKRKMVSKKWLALVFGVIFSVGTTAHAANTPEFSQTISAGTKSVDVVDADGVTVANPTVSFTEASYSFGTQDTTGTLGTSSEKIRAINPTSGETWSVTLAGSATTATWSTGSQYYDFNDGSGYTDGADTDSYGGQMTVDPSGGTLAGVSGCATTNVTKGTSDSFVEGTTDSIDLMSAASGAPTFCRWDLTGVSLTQKVPAAQVGGSYSINMTLTVS